MHLFKTWVWTALPFVLFFCPPARADLTYTNGLTFWLEADTLSYLNDGDTVDSWFDSSPSGFHVSQPTTALRPVFRTNGLNGLPSVFFGSSNDMARASVAGNQLFETNEGTFYFVVNATNLRATHQVFAWSDGLGSNVVNALLPEATDGIRLDHGDRDNGGKMFTPEPSSWFDNYHLVELMRSGSLGEIWVDMTNLLFSNMFTDDLSISGSANIQLGRDTASVGLWGNLAEILVYDHALTQASRDTVLNYLDDKYGFGLIQNIPEPDQWALLCVVFGGSIYLRMRRSKPRT